jgi:NAD(P)-dependent dehydrogenase (short-subunit alcohol dehydrogenase family)
MASARRTLDQFDIRGRSALITGGASGLGLAYVEAMAEAGAGVTIADIDLGGAEREAARLLAQGYSVRAAALDVVDRATTAQVFADHAAAFGGLDIAFANAGSTRARAIGTPRATGTRMARSTRSIRPAGIARLRSISPGSSIRCAKRFV